MNIHKLRKVLNNMANDLQTLLAEIATIHSDHDIETEVNEAVASAVSNAVPAAINAATADMQKQLDSNTVALQAIVDKLTAPGVVATEATSAAVAAAQDAMTPTPTPTSVEPQVDTAAAETAGAANS